VRIGSQEIVVVAVLAVIGGVILCGYFLTKTEESQPIPRLDSGDTNIPAPGGGPHPDSARAGTPTPPRGPQPSARIEFSTTEVSFGTIDPYTVRTSEIVVKNTGNAPLENRGIRATCGCVRAHMDELELAPGEQTTLHIEFNPQHYGGPSPRIRVMMYTNDPAVGIAQVYISADIESEYTVEPAELDFGTIPAGEERVLTVHIEQQLDEVLEIEKVETFRKEFETSFHEVTGTDEHGKKQYEIEVRVPPDTEPGPLDTVLTITTSIKRLSVTQIPIRCRVLGIEPIPTTVHLGLVESDRGEVATVILRGPHAFTVSEANIDIENFMVNVDDYTAKTKHTIEIGMNPNVTPGRKHGILKAITYTNGKRSVTSVPVHGLVRRPTGDL